MKKRLLTSIACAAVLTSTVLPAANYVVQPQSQKVSAATLDQNAFLKKKPLNKLKKLLRNMVHIHQ